jgi:amino acid permease
VYRSFSEIGYIAWGRVSIFIINFIIFFNSFGLMMVYFITFSGIAQSFVLIGIKDPSHLDMFYCKKWFYVLIIAAAAFPLCVKREIKELKLASILLFGSIFLFVIVFII